MSGLFHWIEQSIAYVATVAGLGVLCWLAMRALT
jgi:hypothetical protein